MTYTEVYHKGEPMYKLQIQWLKDGEWFDCVYTPRELEKALPLFRDHQQRHTEHNYRLINV